MNFPQFLQALHTDPQSVIIPSSWANGRASFGGLVAALVYEVMRLQVPDDRPLRSLAITFVGPWQQMMYPYIGLILYVVHGLAIGFAKRADSPAKLGQRRGLLAVQLLALLALTGLMSAKPF